MSLTGYRWWYAGLRPGIGWRLRSVVIDAWWEGPHLTALPAPRMRCLPDCLRWRGLPHAAKRVPAARCACGVHAYRTEQLAMERLACPAYFDSAEAGRIYSVAGTVALWGRVVEHDDGYRAEHALIRRLIVPRRLTARYLSSGIRRSWAPDVPPFDVKLEDLPGPPLAKALERRYGVEVEVGEEIEIVV